MMTAAGACRRDGPFSGEGFLQGRRARGLDVAPEEAAPTGREALLSLNFLGLCGLQLKRPEAA